MTKEKTHIEGAEEATSTFTTSNGIVLTLWDNIDKNTISKQEAEAILKSYCNSIGWEYEYITTTKAAAEARGTLTDVLLDSLEKGDLELVDINKEEGHVFAVRFRDKEYKIYTRLTAGDMQSVTRLPHEEQGEKIACIVTRIAPKVYKTLPAQVRELVTCVVKFLY